jgi:hypothetical protein
MKPCLLFFLLMFHFVQGGDKEKVFIEGKVVDAKTKEPLVSAPVFIDRPVIGIITDKNGYYKIQIPDSLSNKKVFLICKYVGMVDKRIKIRLKKHSVIANFELEERVIYLDTVW